MQRQIAFGHSYEDALVAKGAQIERMHNVNGAAGYGAEIIDRQQLDEMLPGLGPDVIGAAWSPHDGHANPLRLLRGLHAGITSARRGEDPQVTDYYRIRPPLKPLPLSELDGCTDHDGAAE